MLHIEGVWIDEPINEEVESWVKEKRRDLMFVKFGFTLAFKALIYRRKGRNGIVM